MVKTEQLSFQYNADNRIAFPDINCQAGEHWLVLGPSGCGKTTLLHLLAGMRIPTKGSVHINGQNLKSMSSAQRDYFRGQNIGIVFQKPHFVKALNVEENLLLTQFLAKVKQDRTRIKNILEKLNLGHKLKSRPDELSQGEQQRVVIARALLNRPKVILADEPTSALDDKNCQYVLELLEERAKEENAALLIVTHDARLKQHFSNTIQLNTYESA